MSARRPSSVPSGWEPKVFISRATEERLARERQDWSSRRSSRTSMTSQSDAGDLEDALDLLDLRACVLAKLARRENEVLSTPYRVRQKAGLDDAVRKERKETSEALMTLL